MCVHTNWHFSTLTATAVIQQALKNVLSKEGEALRLLRTNSLRVTFEENINNFKTCLISRYYPEQIVEKILSEVKYEDRKETLK